MAVVLRHVDGLLLLDAPFAALESLGLALCHGALLDAVLDALLLVLQALVHLVHARMARLHDRVVFRVGSTEREHASRCHRQEESLAVVAQGGSEPVGVADVAAGARHAPSPLRGPRARGDADLRAAERGAGLMRPSGTRRKYAGPAGSEARRLPGLRDG